MKYPIKKDGEWIQPVKKGYKLRCCDCGLIHKLNFKMVGSKIQFQAFRDYRATGQVRRHYESIKLIKGTDRKKEEFLMVNGFLKKQILTFLKQNKHTKDLKSEDRLEFHAHICKIIDSELDKKRIAMNQSVYKILGSPSRFQEE